MWLASISDLETTRIAPSNSRSFSFCRRVVQEKRSGFLMKPRMKGKVYLFFFLSYVFFSRLILKLHVCQVLRCTSTSLTFGPLRSKLSRRAQKVARLRQDSLRYTLRYISFLPFYWLLFLVKYDLLDHAMPCFLVNTPDYYFSVIKPMQRLEGCPEWPPFLSILQNCDLPIFNSSSK